ncbi:hypothetical protein R3P38DRAFT_3185056 [Favolaschia claudopus]|uniref:Transposase n=1 Tax=Favolaschia claudopus TaxID=2862362 RepID=A0AAV9ZHN2_9AGAR
MPYNTFRYIPPAHKRLMIPLAANGMSNKEIAAAINVGESTVRKVKRLWHTTGYVVARPETNGRPSILTSLDLEVVSHSQS